MALWTPCGLRNLALARARLFPSFCDSAQHECKSGPRIVDRDVAPARPTWHGLANETKKAYPFVRSSLTKGFCARI